ncbi:LysR family transcriptional regulator ArgP [Ammonicoccus fulvus]|uniref:LysR family transcriptional regulator ArgP n=1 Tax=Ammonicoccus fulvus TaxID=3138240 RepID=A0ABZ3FTX5_9ACTN
MELDQLRTLAAVTDTGSFELAAEALTITPSAVSQRIKALEAQLGRGVLIRARPCRPTQSGEVLLRLARRMLLLEAEALTELGQPDVGPTQITIVVNSDSLATWALPALTAVAQDHDVLLDIRREDQGLSTALLRDGTAMAAVTSVAQAVPGCRVRRLGAMRYHPMATAEFIERWFGDGVTPAALAAAPVIIFDRDDNLQDQWLRTRTHKRLDPPRHYVPESTSYVAAVRLGLGWGLVPTDQHSDDLIELVPDEVVEVPLFWQQWKLASPVLDALADALAYACP